MVCSVGAWGWKHSGWENGVFYPDDLPSDWQLSYYANEFNLVVVPASYYRSTGFDAEQYSDDVSPGFAFYIDWPFQQLSNQADYYQCAENCQQFAEQLSAVLVNNEYWKKLTAEQKSWFETATKGMKVIQYTKTSILDSASGLLLLSSESNETLRDLGGRLKTLLANADIEHIVLANENVEMPRLKELQTLAALIRG